METNIEKILSELLIRVKEHFNLSAGDALASVAESHLANELSEKGNIRNLSIDELSSQLFLEIARGE